jgi:inosose dehydratase
MHFKDIDGQVLQRAREQRMSFWDALAAGVFCPLGDGVVDFAQVAEQLDAAGYTAFATIEQDRVPGTGSPLSDIASSLAVLAAAGFRHAADSLQSTESR